MLLQEKPLPERMVEAMTVEPLLLWLGAVEVTASFRLRYFWARQSSHNTLDYTPIGKMRNSLAVQSERIDRFS